MPERSRYSGLAQALAGRQGGEGRGFWRGIGDVLSGTPIGRLVHGDLRGAWNATPAGMAVNAARNIFGGRGGPSSPAGSPMGAFGPTTGGYGGAPGPSAAPSWGGTDWGTEINGSQGGGAQMGPWQGAPALLPGQAPPSTYAGAAQTMGAASGLGGNQGSGFIGGAQMVAPLKQSGIFFTDRQQER